MILVAAHQWPQMVRAIGKPELAVDPRFRGAQERHKNRFELQAIIEEWLASFLTRDDTIGAMDKERVPCAPEERKEANWRRCLSIEHCFEKTLQLLLA
jgi:CoA:oxalate CoA-transferase